MATRSARWPTVYLDLRNINGTEIRQQLNLRIVPILGTVRFLPFGRAGGVQPYVGVGAGVIRYRYSEIGQFVDPADFNIFEDRYIATGYAPAGAVMGGVKLPLGGDIYGLNLEYRYQFGTGETGGPAKGFYDDKIDLSGGAFNVLFQLRF